MEYKYIVNPMTNRKVNVNSRLGKSIIKAYKKNMKGGVLNADSFIPSGTPRFFELLEDRWTDTIKSYNNIDKITDEDEYWGTQRAYEEGINLDILNILAQDENGDFFDVTDEFGRENTLEPRLRKWYSEYLPSEAEDYREGMTILEKKDHLRLRMTGDVEGDLDALYNYPDHRAIAALISSERDYLDDESSEEEVRFWTETIDTEFLDSYKQILLDIIYPMPKAAVVAMPRDS